MKYRYLDKVKIISGFYEGMTGAIRGHHKPKDTDRYLVELHTDIVKSEWFNEDELIKIETVVTKEV